MPTSQRSSHASEICRLEWRPSRLLAAVLVLLGVLAAGAVLASEVPHIVAWPLAGAALLHGVRLAGRYSRQCTIALVWDGHAGIVRIDGVAVADARLAWRGPLAFVRYRDVSSGKVRRLAWWPDALPPPRRRELRLAAGLGSGGRSRASMAP